MRKGLELLAGLVLEDGRRWGDAVPDWQWADARAFLDPGGSEPYSFFTRPRAASKTTDLASVGSAALLTQLPEVSRSYAVAADEDQAGLLLDAAAGFVARTDGLERELRMERRRLVSISYLLRRDPGDPCRGRPLGVRHPPPPRRGRRARGLAIDPRRSARLGSGDLGRAEAAAGGGPEPSSLRCFLCL